MAVSRKLIKELRRQLELNGDKKLAEKNRVYVKSSVPLYGVKAATIRRIAKSVIKQFPLSNFEHWCDTVLALWRGAKYREERACAIELCEFKTYRSYQTLDTLPLYEEMIVTGAWWDLVDPIAAHRIRYLLEQFPKAMTKTLKLWSNGDDIWLRRAAILSQLRRKQDTDLRLLYECIQPSLDSDEFFLQKAIGWALRDYAWTDMAEVRRYVKVNDGRLSKLSKREALKHQERNANSRRSTVNS